MAFPQILTFPTPLRDIPSLKKRMSNSGKRLNKAIKSRIKTIRKSISLTAKKHYFLPTAYKDLRSAAAKNEDIVLTSVAWTTIMVYACASLTLEFLVAMSRITYALAEASGYDMGVLILVFGPIVALFTVLLMATSFNFMSLAIMDGANRKVYRTIRSTLARSLTAASRITGAWFLLSVVHAFRLLVVLIPLAMYVKYFHRVAHLSYEAVAAAAAIGLVWFIVGLFRYSLVPYIALYEPKMILDLTFVKSRQMVNRQAVVFMITGLTSLALYCFGLYKLCVYLKGFIGIGTNLLFVLGIMAGIMLANGGMAMLYRKRKLARS